MWYVLVPGSETILEVMQRSGQDSHFNKINTKPQLKKNTHAAAILVIYSTIENICKLQKSRDRIPLIKVSIILFNSTRSFKIEV